MFFFRDILRQCAELGLVCGRTQAVDSAFIKANVSSGSISEKELIEKSKKYFDEVISNEDACAQPGKCKSGRF